MKTTWNESIVHMQDPMDTGHVAGVSTVTCLNINVAVLFDRKPGEIQNYEHR